MEKKYFILFYEVVSDYVSRRAPFRAEHLALAQGAAARGELVLGGAYDEPADGAALVFYVTDRKAIMDFVEADPYVRAGLVTAWKIRRYNAVVGSACATPVQLPS